MPETDRSSDAGEELNYSATVDSSPPPGTSEGGCSAPALLLILAAMVVVGVVRARSGARPGRSARPTDESAGPIEGRNAQRAMADVREATKRFHQEAVAYFIYSEGMRRELTNEQIASVRGDLPEVLSQPVLELQELKAAHPDVAFDEIQEGILREWGGTPQPGPTLRAQLRVLLLAKAKVEAETRLDDTP